MRTRLAVAELDPPPGPELSSIFLCFLKLGSFAFGGVFAMLSFFDRELVQRRRWITADELAECVVIGQMTPGPPIVNTGVLVGHRLRGVPGAVAATVGQVLPGFVVVLIVGVLYAELRSAPLVQGALKGVGAAVVGLLGSVVFSIGRRVVDGARTGLLAVAAFALLAFARANPVLLLLGAGLAGWLLFRERR
ncbi:MAG TPA: chromate transporter [Anaeromyxobacter sp.]|nr:chromate transporter [Anaeromyxobacter sp.]